MQTSRRHFLKSTLASGAFTLSPGAAASTIAYTASDNAIQQHTKIALSPYSVPTDNGQNHFIAVLDKATGSVIASLPTPERCHGGCLHPTQALAVVFGRRPAHTAYVIDTIHYKIIHTLHAEPDHHLFGHGIFTRDGKFLISTEQHYPTSTGVLLFRDVHNNFQVVKRMKTHGIGPHELVELHDKPIIAVANGGIKTHPKWPRQKLNLDNMAPNLAYLDMVTGKLIEKVALPRASLSIRHLAIRRDNTLVFVQQDQVKGEGHEHIIAQHQLGSAYQTMHSAPTTFMQLKSYIGSVAIMENQAMITSPRGHVAMLWNLNTQTLEKVFKQKDICGCSYDATNKRFLLSTGKGKLLTYTKGSQQLSSLNDYANYAFMWDNHLVV